MNTKHAPQAKAKRAKDQIGNRSIRKEGQRVFKVEAIEIVARETDFVEWESNSAGFKRILLFDGTSFQRPKELAKFFRGSGGGGSEAAIKITFGYDIKADNFFYLLSDGVANENLSQNGFHHQMKICTCTKTTRGGVFLFSARHYAM